MKKIALWAVCLTQYGMASAPSVLSTAHSACYNQAGETRQESRLTVKCLLGFRSLVVTWSKNNQRFLEVHDLTPRVLRMYGYEDAIKTELGLVGQHEIEKMFAEIKLSVLKRACETLNPKPLRTFRIDENGYPEEIE